jgi:4-hydroxy-2-oxoheptanedioate aldolase
VSAEEYLERADAWPLNPDGELMLGVKIESPSGLEHVEEILAVPGLAFAELGPNDLGLQLGYRKITRDPYPPELQDARERIFRACRNNGVAFLENCAAAAVARKIDEGVRIFGTHVETALAGRDHTRRLQGGG